MGFCRISGLLLLAGSVSTFAAGQTKNLTYKGDVEPIVRKHCLPCHSEDNENPSGLILDTYESMLKGGEHDDILVPGKPEESNFYRKLLSSPPFGKQMPRRRGKLSEEEIRIIYDWIAGGARKE